MGTEEWEGQQDCYDGSNGEASGDKEDEAKPEVASVFFETREARVNSSQVNRITCFSSTLKARLGAQHGGYHCGHPYYASYGNQQQASHRPYGEASVHNNFPT